MSKKRKNIAEFQGKYWTWTENNPTIESHPPNIWPDVEYAIWQFEVGENETPHIQGYVCFRKVKRLNWIKNHTVYEAHWEPRMGKHDEAKHYCMKPVDDCDCKHCIAAIGGRIAGPWEHGDDSRISNGQGDRSDMDHVKEMVIEGHSELEIAQEHFGVWCRNHAAIERFRMLLGNKPSRRWITFTNVIWGAPGIGKTQYVDFHAGPDAYWLTRPAGPVCYWDDYNGQEDVVIDEFSGWIQREVMQRICDSKPYDVKVHGGQVPFLAKRIWITCNQPPSQWWRNIGLGPMERRLGGKHGKVTHMITPWIEPTADDILDELLVPSQTESLLDFYAIDGTPPGAPSPERDPFDQVPLSRCPGCQARQELPDEYCEACVERAAHCDIDLPTCPQCNRPEPYGEICNPCLWSQIIE